MPWAPWCRCGPTVHRVTITWPDGSRQHLIEVPLRQTLQVVQAGMDPSFRIQDLSAGSEGGFLHFHAASNWTYTVRGGAMPLSDPPVLVTVPGDGAACAVGIRDTLDGLAEGVFLLERSAGSP